MCLTPLLSGVPILQESSTKYTNKRCGLDSAGLCDSREIAVIEALCHSVMAKLDMHSPLINRMDDSLRDSHRDNGIEMESQWCALMWQ